MLILHLWRRALVTVFLLVFALASSCRPGEAATNLVEMSVSAGWNGHYREGGSWVPVRVTLRSNSSAVISGDIQINDVATTDEGGFVRPIPTVYDAPVTLPPGAVKHMLLSLPGMDVQGEVDVRFDVGGQTVATQAAFPVPFSADTTTIGAMTNDPSSVSWLSHLVLPGGRYAAITVGLDVLRAPWEVLSAFDALILSNLDTGRLDDAQRVGLQRYVQEGGTLFLIGGPDWQETLQRLPTALLPGPVVGSRSIDELPLPSCLGRSGATHLRVQTIISIIRGRRGWICARAGAMPLVAVTRLGLGQVVYLAFDPGVVMTRSSRYGAVVGTLLGSLTPEAMRRAAIPVGYVTPTHLEPGAGPLAVSTEMANIQPPNLQLLLPILMVALYLSIAAVVGMVITRRIDRALALWIAVPLVALTSVVLTGSVAGGEQGENALVNTVGVVTMDGHGPRYPAHLYTGITAWRSGTYTLSYSGGAQVSTAGQYVRSRQSSSLSATPWMVTEGSETQIRIPPARSGRTRTVALRAEISLGASIGANLRLDSSGAIVGTVHNGAAFPLLRPALVAGQAAVRLPTIVSGESIRVRLVPTVAMRRHDAPPMAIRLYGQTTLYGSRSTLPTEGTLDARIANAMGILPEVNDLSPAGQVQLLAWTDQPLAPLRLEGGLDSAPGRRDLTLIVQPITVNFPNKTFHLRIGTIDARLLAALPARPESVCCGPLVQSMYLASGGSAVFAFDLPQPSRLRARKLAIVADVLDPYEYAAQYESIPPGLGSTYNWRLGRWLPLDFRQGKALIPDPGNAVSATGIVLLKVSITNAIGGLAVMNPQHDLQIEGDFG